MSLFKNKWLAMMLLCGSMDLTYVDAMRRYPERKVDDVASCFFDKDGYMGNYTLRTVAAHNDNSYRASLVHTYHMGSELEYFYAQFAQDESKFFLEAISKFLPEFDISQYSESVFLSVMFPEDSVIGAPLLFRPHFLFLDQYLSPVNHVTVEKNMCVQAIMIENQNVKKLCARNHSISLHPSESEHAYAISPDKPSLQWEGGEEVRHDPEKSRIVVGQTCLTETDGTPYKNIVNVIVLLNNRDRDIWKECIRENAGGTFGQFMLNLSSKHWLESCYDVFSPGALFSSFLMQMPQPTMVEVLPEQGQPVVPSSDAKVPPKKNLHLRLCLPPEPEQPVVPQPTMVEVLPEQEQPVVPSSDVGVRLCQRRVLENDTSYTLSDCDTVRLPIRIRQMVTGSEGIQDVNLILSASISDPEFVGAVCSSFAWDLQTDTDKQVDFFIATRDWNLSSICLVNEEDRLSHMWILKKGLRDEVSCEGSIGKLDIRSDGEFNSDSSCVVCYKQLMGQDGSINCGVVLLLDPSDANKYMQVLRTAEAPTIGASLSECWSRNALHDVAELRVLSAFFKW